MKKHATIFKYNANYIEIARGSFSSFYATIFTIELNLLTIWIDMIPLFKCSISDVDTRNFY